MSKTPQYQEQEIGGFDDSYIDKLNPKDPDYLEKFYEAVTGKKYNHEKDEKNKVNE